MKKKFNPYPIKVLHLRSTPSLGSPEKLILGRIKQLSPEKCKYYVGIFNEQKGGQNDFHKALTNAGVSSFLLKDPIVYSYSNFVTIFKRIKETKPNLICTHDYKSNFFGFILKKVTGIPAISVFHGLTQTDKKVKFYQIVDRIVLKGFNGIICVCDAIKSKLTGWLPAEKLHVIPNAVDIDEITKLTNKENEYDSVISGNGKRIITFAGRLSKEKGLEYLIQAAEILLDQHDNLLFLIIGDGPERDFLMQMISKKGLDNSIHMLGFKKYIYSYLKISQFVILPSLTEGMPVVVLEAFALAKAVIASNVGGVAELIQDGINGLLVKPKDVEGLAKAIQNLLEKPYLASEMGNHGKEMVEKYYEFNSQANGYLEYYEKILNKHFAT